MIPGLRYVFILEDNRLRDDLSQGMKELDSGVEYDFYEAAGAEDALRHVSLYCDLHKDIDTCFVSCGGDVLTAGVAAGLMGSGEGKCLAVYDPKGTNSLARSYEGMDFGSLAKILAGSPTAVDMIRVNNSYAVNACTFGLDDLMKGKGFIPSISAILRRSFRTINIKADGMILDTGSVLLFILANGKYASGGLHCAPLASNDDGKMDLCIVKNLPPTRLMKLLPALASGGLTDEPAFAGDTILRRVKTLEIESAKEMTLFLDGIPLTDKHFKARIIPAAIRLVIPAG